jgi:hypothetical protein
MLKHRKTQIRWMIHACLCRRKCCNRHLAEFVFGVKKGCVEMSVTAEAASALCKNQRLSSDDGKFVKTHASYPGYPKYPDHPEYPFYPDANWVGVKQARAT